MACQSSHSLSLCVLSIDMHWLSNLLILRQHLTGFTENISGRSYVYMVCWQSALLCLRTYTYEQAAVFRLKMATQTSLKLLPVLDKAEFYYHFSSLWPSIMLCNEYHASRKAFIILTILILQPDGNYTYQFNFSSGKQQETLIHDFVPYFISITYDQLCSLSFAYTNLLC